MKTDTVKRRASLGSGEFARDDFSSLGENVVFEPGVLVFHPETISIGANVYVGHRTILQGYYKSTMTIGENCWIGTGCFLHSGGGIRIGNTVGLGHMVKIVTSVHRDDDLSMPVLIQEVDFREVVIEDGVHVGVGATILPGVRIGEGAMVGAGSVVTRSVEPYTVVAGNPARFLRRRGD